MKKITRKKTIRIISASLAIALILSLGGTLAIYIYQNKNIYNNYSGGNLTEEELYEMFKRNAAAYSLEDSSTPSESIPSDYLETEPSATSESDQAAN